MFPHVTADQRPTIRLSELDERRQAAVNAQQHFESRRASEQRIRNARRSYTGPRSAMLGKFGLTLVVASLVALIWATIAATPDVTAVLQQAGYMGDAFDPDLLPDALLAALGTTGLILNIASWVGTAGWIVSIVAASTDRGKRQAVIGIVLGVLEPMVVAIVFMFAVWITVAAS